MSTTTYSIDDMYGTQIAAGLRVENEAYRIAQREACQRGEIVTLWTHSSDEDRDDDDDDVEVVPPTEWRDVVWTAQRLLGDTSDDTRRDLETITRARYAERTDGYVTAEEVVSILHEARAERAAELAAEGEVAS